MKVPQYLYATNEELQRFMALFVQQAQSDLSDNGWQTPQLSAANVTTITSASFLPVMRAGTFWFNTDLKKLQFITDAAIPSGPTNAVIETVTSV